MSLRAHAGLGGTLAVLAFTGACLAAEPGSRPAGSAERVNVLFITADDLDYGSLGVTGCRVPGITPNLDRLAREGMRFEHGHVTVAVCQPSRSVLMTGRYPWRNGAMGFEPIRPDVPTLTESLRASGYFNGIFAKVSHLAPQPKFCWDVAVDAPELGNGRSPELYYRHAKAFFEAARTSGKPFFLMANTQDPHRPFAGSAMAQQAPPRRRQRAAAEAGVPLFCSPDAVDLPCFLPDLPDVRRELAQYFTSVHRSDASVGEILRALEETGAAAHTLVMFISDNGMSFPFAKTNCYECSTRTPWIVRWPGHVRPGSVDGEHFISGIDFMPTVLEVTGAAAPEGMDGTSFADQLRARRNPARDAVYTVFHQTSGRRDFPMRAIRTKGRSYIFNAWSDGKTVFQNEAQSGLSFPAMRAAAEQDARVGARVRLFQYRVPEELYDLDKDPCELRNVIDDARYARDLTAMRSRMRTLMEQSKDPLLEAFIRRSPPTQK